MAKRGNGAGSVYRRKSDGKWVGSITLEDSSRKVFYGKTQKEVQDKVNEALYELQRGMLPTSSNATVQDFRKRFYRGLSVLIEVGATGFEPVTSSV